MLETITTQSCVGRTDMIPADVSIHRVQRSELGCIELRVGARQHSRVPLGGGGECRRGSPGLEKEGISEDYIRVGRIVVL